MVLRGCDDDPARRTRAHRASRKDKEKYKRAGSRLGFEDARAGSGGHAPRGIPRTLARLAPACLNLPCARFKSKRRSPSFAEAAQPWRFWPMRSPTRSTRDFRSRLVSAGLRLKRRLGRRDPIQCNAGKPSSLSHISQSTRDLPIFGARPKCTANRESPVVSTRGFRTRGSINSSFWNV